jgi:alcohol dehydrogenase
MAKCDFLHVVNVRAAVLEEIGQPPTITTLELDAPGQGEVLVRVRAAGLCHSDLSVIDGSRPRPVPMVLGHEIAGEVTALGPDVTGLSVGEHVVASFVPACGSCGYCRGGRPALCEPGAAANTAGVLLGGERRLHRGDGPVHHHLGVSGFAEHAVVSERSLVSIDAELPWEIAALFGCAVLTGVGAVVNAASVRPGQSVAVFGLGGVGLSALLGSVAAGAWPIVAVDRVPEKLQLARELGASHAVMAGDDVVQEVRALTGGGVDHAIETGRRRHRARTGLRQCAPGGDDDHRRSAPPRRSTHDPRRVADRRRAPFAGLLSRFVRAGSGHSALRGSVPGGPPAR